MRWHALHSVARKLLAAQVAIAASPGSCEYSDHVAALCVSLPDIRPSLLESWSRSCPQVRCSLHFTLSPFQSAFRSTFLKVVACLAYHAFAPAAHLLCSRSYYQAGVGIRRSVHGM